MTYIAESSVMRLLFREMEYLAAGWESVQLVGGPGVGKTALAHYLHGRALRLEGSFVQADCRATPAHWMSVALFGSPCWRFPGLLERAHGGTLFLKNVDALSLEAQARLLDFLESGGLRRPGELRGRPLRLRLVVSAGEPLERLAGAGGMLPEFVHALEAQRFLVPPLRQRRRDILPLAEHFLQIAARGAGRCPPEFSPRARLALLGHDWPFNLVELRRRVVVAVACGDALDPEALGLQVVASVDTSQERDPAESTLLRLELNRLRVA